MLLSVPMIMAGLGFIWWARRSPARNGAAT
jgi:prolipoprotein diacylglyceryltransferase